MSLLHSTSLLSLLSDESSQLSSSQLLTSRPSSPLPSGSAARLVRALRSSEFADTVSTSDLTAAFMELELNTTGPSPQTLLLSPSTPPAVVLVPTPTLTFSTWLNRIEEFLLSIHDAVLLCDLGKNVPAGTGRPSISLHRLLKRDKRFELLGTGNQLRVHLRRAVNVDIIDEQEHCNTTAAAAAAAAAATAATATPLSDDILMPVSGKTQMVELAKAKRQLLVRLRGLQSVAEKKRKMMPLTAAERRPCSVLSNCKQSKRN